MSKKTVSSIIGNIKRNYTKDDFNPFMVMDFVYNHCLSRGAGSKVVIVGYGDRFSGSIIPAMHHVMASRKILTSPPVPYPIAGEITSHTGCIIRFVNIADSQHEQANIMRELNEADIAVMCKRYSHPVIKQVLRFKNPTMMIYDQSREAYEQLSEKAVDT